MIKGPPNYRFLMLGTFSRRAIVTCIFSAIIISLFSLSTNVIPNQVLELNNDDTKHGLRSINDNDSDGVLNDDDDCTDGDTGWTSSSTTDYDSDGCQDLSEDDDDDNDGVIDTEDTCFKGNWGWTSNSSTDYDGDGCRDSSEDSDDD